MENIAKELTVLKISAKGAMLITDGEKVAWIKPSMRRSDGTFTPGAYQIIQCAVETMQEYTVRYEHILGGEKFSVWQKSEDFFRIYFRDNSYIQISIKDRHPNGYYETHRYSKGERVWIAYVSSVGEIAGKIWAENKHIISRIYFPSGQGCYEYNGERWYN